ncbi:MAG: hypothetical protein ACRCSS_06800 [Shewanella sp.]
MHKPLIYLDLNIVSAQANGKLTIQKPNDAVLVYSKEHFSEIRRSADPDKYLDVLESFDAQLVDSELDASFKETGRTLLIQGSSPQHHFNQYLEAIKDTSYNEEVIYPLIAWVNGGAVLDNLVQMPVVMKEQLSELLAILPDEYRHQLGDVDAVQDSFEKAIKDISENDNHIMQTRAAFGVPRSGLTNIEGPDQLKKIWEIVSTNVSQPTIDEFFGFKPNNVFVPANTEVKYGIIACCAMFDLLGFHAEQKSRKLGSIANVQSDARHIAMAASCSALLTSDHRMAERARAIYEYLQNGTTVCEVQIRKLQNQKK